jgi:hypothetical protein
MHPRYQDLRPQPEIARIVLISCAHRIKYEKYLFYFRSPLGHANIIRFCNRPFSSVEEMDAELIRRWNEEIGPDDDVYHLAISR